MKMIEDIVQTKTIVTEYAFILQSRKIQSKPKENRINILKVK